MSRPLHITVIWPAWIAVITESRSDSSNLLDILLTIRRQIYLFQPIFIDRRIYDLVVYIKHAPFGFTIVVQELVESTVI